MICGLQLTCAWLDLGLPAAHAYLVAILFEQGGSISIAVDCQLQRSLINGYLKALGQVKDRLKLEQKTAHLVELLYMVTPCLQLCIDSAAAVCHAFCGHTKL